MWWKFRRHRLAVVAGPLLAAIYLVALFADFVAPYGVSTRFPDYLSAPPNRIRLLGAGGGGADAAGGAYVYGLRVERHPHTLRKIYEPDRERRYAVRFLGQGEEYRFWGDLQDPHPPVRARRRGRPAVPVRHRPARPRPVFARAVRGAHLAVDRPGGSADQHRAGGAARRRGGLLRRRGRPGGDAAGRPAGLDPYHSAVDGAGGGGAAAVVGAHHLLRHYPDPVAGGLDPPGARGARTASCRCARRTS